MDEIIKKEIKKNRKMIKKIRNNLNFDIIMAWIILAVILLVPCVNALNIYPSSPSFIMDMNKTYTYPISTDFIDGTNYCIAYHGSGWSVHHTAIGTGTSGGLYSNGTLIAGGYVEYCLDNSTRGCSYTFNSSVKSTIWSYVSCQKSGFEGQAHFNTVWNRADLNNDLSVLFTVVPSSGNQTLNVTFYPVILGTNINRAVWDYDGHLGSETKYTNINSPFYKEYNVAGHFLPKLTVYDNNGVALSASQHIDVYNYTQNITPTPTLTPIVTPTGGINGTNVSEPITVYLQDYYNLSAIPTVSIGMQDMNDISAGWRNITTGINGEYSFSGYGTGGNIPLVNGHRYWLQFQKSGYKTKDSEITYTNVFSRNGYYLTPNEYNPTSSNFVLEVNLHSTTTGIINSAKTGTVTISNQSSSWTSISSNPPAGVVIFTGLTPSASYKFDIALSGYKAYTGYFASSSSMAGTTQYYHAYLEDTTNLPSSYTLSISPTAGTINDTYFLKINGDLSNAQSISFRYTPLGSNMYHFTSGAGQTDYSLVSGTWKQWDGSTYSISSSPLSGVNAKLLSYVPLTDEVTVTAYITSTTGNIYQTSTTLNIVSSGNNPVMIVAYDMSGSGGADAALMTDYTSHIMDVYSGIWVNTTYNQGNFASALYSARTGGAIYYYGSAIGYLDTIPITKTIMEGGSIQYRFYKNNLPPTVDNVTLYGMVQTSSSVPIPNAKVIFSDGQKCFTNTAGSCGVYALNNHYYSATGSAYGYTAGTAGITTSNTSSNVITIVLLKTTTTTSPYSGISTPKVTPTFTNTSGMQNTTPLTEVACIDDTSNLRPYELFMNFIACMGVKGGIQQGFVLSALMMFIFAMGLSRYGKGLGTLAGVIIGAVTSFGMGILPFWVLIVAIVICGLVFARLLTSQSEK